MKPQLSAIVLTLLAFSAVSGKDFTVAQVLAHPRDFAGKRISITGFYVAANEESSLYVTREAAKRGDIERSIWVELPHWPLNSNRATEFRRALKRYREGHRDDGLAGYVRFVGRFHYNPDSHGKPFGGYGQWGLSPTQLDVTSLAVLR
jgi:hypothetical protein